MTKKHFISFARYIKNQIQINGLSQDEALKMAKMVMFVALEDNPRFDSTRFLDACGLR